MIAFLTASSEASHELLWHAIRILESYLEGPLCLDSVQICG